MSIPRFVCDRGVSHELVRHRALSFCQSSTRYVRLNDDVEFIEPWWWNDAEREQSALEDMRRNFTDACATAWRSYSRFLSAGEPPQLARAVLPNAVKTELVVTGTIPLWREFLRLRDDPAAHPDTRALARQFSSISGIAKRLWRGGDPGD